MFDNACWKQSLPSWQYHLKVVQQGRSSQPLLGVQFQQLFDNDLCLHRDSDVSTQNRQKRLKRLLNLITWKIMTRISLSMFGCSKGGSDVTSHPQSHVSLLTIYTPVCILEWEVSSPQVMTPVHEWDMHKAFCAFRVSVLHADAHTNVKPHEQKWLAL